MRHIGSALVMKGWARVDGNTAADTAGRVALAGESSILMKDHAQIASNQATDPDADGGGLRVVSGTITMQNSSRIVGNRAVLGGSGVVCPAPAAELSEICA